MRRLRVGKPYNCSVSVSFINRILVLLGAAGLFITSYLTYAHVTNTTMWCSAGSACDLVAARPESKWFGIPVAAFGLLGYLILFALAGVRSLAWEKFGPGAVKLGTLVSGVGFLVSVFLVLTLKFKLNLNCDWCFASAGVMTLTFLLHLALRKARTPEGDPPLIDAVIVPFAAVAALGMAAVSLSDRPQLPPQMNVNTAPLTYERLIPHPSYLKEGSNARVTLVEIADFYCPACRSMFPAIDALKRQYPDTLSVGYRSLPLFKVPGHENSLAASLAAEYARRQGKYWEFLGAMYSEGADQAVRSDLRLADILDNFELDGKAWLDTYRDTSSQMFKDLDQGIKLFDEIRLSSTPTFVLFIDKKDPLVVDGMRLVSILEAPPYKDLLGSGTRR